MIFFLNFGKSRISEILGLISENKPPRRSSHLIMIISNISHFDCVISAVKPCPGY